MSAIEAVRGALAEFGECYEYGQDIAVPTQYLYPSNGSVVVFVAPATSGSFVVSDRGGALDELSSLGLGVDSPNRFLSSFCKPAGLETKAGEIITRPVPQQRLATSIVYVARASSMAARHGLESLRPKRRRDLAKTVHQRLVMLYGENRIRRSANLPGASNRQYHFDFVVSLDHNHTLAIDTVMPDPKSLNAKVVSHLDVARAEHPGLAQRIVYDDEEQWGAADLALLQMVATTVPLSSLDSSLARLTVH